MLKGKPKFDIKQFFIRHGEKILLGLIVPLAIWIALWGTKFEPLSWLPEDLTKSANDARSRVDNNERTATQEGVSVFRYDILARQIKTPVDPRYYQTRTVWNPSVFPERLPRTEPEVFAVHDLKARSGIGAIQVKPKTTVAGGFGFGGFGAGGSSPATAKELEGKRWVVLTGLIPVRRQLDTYLAIFPSSKFHDPFRDHPMYVKYDVERCEETPTGRTPWVSIDPLKSFYEESLKWVGFSAERVDRVYLAPTPPGMLPMAYPLPPLVKKEFGKEITHSPIPLLMEMLKEDQEKYARRMEEYQKQMEKFDPSVIDQFDPFQAGQGGTIGREPRGLGGSPFRAASGIPGELGSGQFNTLEEDTIVVNDYLFRFFDFDVEVGKTYRYRVKLHLANPNYKLGAANLADPALADKKYLETEFSGESDAVTLGTDARVLASEIAGPAPRTPWAE
ncbi:MAG TPA: hypothetical protein DEB39_14110, partial [Planctomycetaceae bacterium]|nr:hypothetical protein [Planctomycetaceae bacterium]